MGPKRKFSDKKREKDGQKTREAGEREKEKTGRQDEEKNTGKVQNPVRTRPRPRQSV